MSGDAREPTDAEVELAFKEWCAMVGASWVQSGEPGSFRLRRTAGGEVSIEQHGERGQVRVICAPMSRRGFCDAVQFVHESRNLQTVQVARMVSKRRGPRR